MARRPLVQSGLQFTAEKPEDVSETPAPPVPKPAQRNAHGHEAKEPPLFRCRRRYRRGAPRGRPVGSFTRAGPGVWRRQIHRFEARRPVPGCSGRRACHRRRERRCPSCAVKSRAIKKGGNALFRSLIRSAPASQSAPVSSSFFCGAQSRYHGAMQMTQGRYAKMARRLPT